MAEPKTLSRDEITITPLNPEELEAAVAVLARGMRDNPLHIAALGEDVVARQRGLARLFGSAASVLHWDRQMLAARDAAGTIVGVCGMALPGRCRPSASQRLRMLPAMVGLGPSAAGRVTQWMGAWAHHDPAEPHWHLGPIAVDDGLQGRGIGSRLMETFCAKVDADGAAAWLETDKAINVQFYERFGFETVAEEPLLGTTSWYMIRRPRGETTQDQ
jgi:ribosomal protein S18 acetylase RimI-like enzyme